MLRKGILPPFQTLNNELILYQALKFGDSNVKLGNKIVNDLLRTWHWHVNMKPKQISMFSRNGFSLWPWHDIDMSIWSRSRFPCLPKTDSHFGQSETWIRARSDSKIKYNNALEDHSLVINRQINTYLEQGGYNNNPGIFAKNAYLSCFCTSEKNKSTFNRQYDPN